MPPKKKKGGKDKPDKEGFVRFSPDASALDADRSVLKRVYLMLRGCDVEYYLAATDTVALGKFLLMDGDFKMNELRSCKLPEESNPKAFDVVIKCKAKDSVGRNTYLHFGFLSEAEADEWSSYLYRALMPPQLAAGIAYRGTAEELSLVFSNVGSGPITPATFESVKSWPMVKNAPAFQRRAVLFQKIRLCSIVFPFTADKENDYLREKQEKRTTLLEIIDICDNMKGVFSETRTLGDVLKMIKINLFRSLPSKVYGSGDGDTGDDEEKAFMDPSWPHLSLVYELLLHLVQNVSIDPKIKKKLIDKNFIVKLLELFDSEDQREREYLKTTTHRIYGKLTNRRGVIRQAINNIFYDFTYADGMHLGIAELLEILASIINGFAVPIKDEHKMMLTQSLIPLHKSTLLINYHPQLAYCMNLFATKDPSMVIHIINGMLKYWPFACSSKEILYLNELDDLFQHVESLHFTAFRNGLLRRLVKCMECVNYQVIERTILMWNNKHVVRLLIQEKEHRETALRALFPSLYKICKPELKKHWNSAVGEMARHVLDAFADSDKILYNAVERECKLRDASL